MTEKWQKFQEQKHLYPNLRYETVGDAKVRPEHQVWDGVVLPIDHPFWNTRYPPNDWGCRCDVVQTDETPAERPVNQGKVPRNFSHNPARSGKIFKDPAYAQQLSKDQLKTAYALAKSLLRQESKIEKAAKEYQKFGKQWKKVFFNKKSGGYLVIDQQRITHALKSKNAQSVFEKEKRMSSLFGNNGFRVKMIKEVENISSYDVMLNDLPAELKSLSSANNIIRHAKNAINKKGAKIVLFEFKNMTPEIHKELNKLKIKNIKVYYYCLNDKIIKEL